MTESLEDAAAPRRSVRSRIRPWATRAAGALARRIGGPADLAIFHDFRPPPYGGGNQFMLALRGELRRRAFRIERDVISPGTRACLFNSFNFDFNQLRRAARGGCRMVHRVDGPIGTYRGGDAALDRRIWELNREFADVTIFQSRYSLDAHRELGFEFAGPTVIMNAVDPAIFHPPARPPARHRGDRVRVVSSSWSTNRNKGAAIYAWLDRNLDLSRYEYTFIGRAPVEFQRIRTVPAVPSGRLADLLRRHDIYIAPSLADPCSNALIEALACGLPAIYARSGGHPEIVGEAGFAFDASEEIPDLLRRLVDEHDVRRSRIRIPSLVAVADRYLDAMGLAAR